MPTLEPSCSCSHGPSVAQGKWYGVRSYLHLFYEDCSGADPDGDTDNSSPSHPHSVWSRIIWKVTLSTGALFLLVGAAALAVGWMVPPRLENIGEEELVVLDVQAMRYNLTLGTCWLLGTALCIVAAVLGTECSPWAQHGWLWAQDSKGRQLDTSFQTSSHTDVGCDDKESVSSGFRGKSAVQTWVPTP
ncbi:NRSN2 protein, partial [Odontophorus gujanensis]|nr:NRSN2 protein [Odontophorus gujanensis]